MTVEPQPTIAELQAENARLRQGLAVALEQQATTSEVLRVIASAPTSAAAMKVCLCVVFMCSPFAFEGMSHFTFTTCGGIHVPSSTACSAQ